VNRPIRAIRQNPSLMLPTLCPAELEVESCCCASISGTSASGDNVHLVLKRVPANNLPVVAMPCLSIQQPTESNRCCQHGDFTPPEPTSVMQHDWPMPRSQVPEMQDLSIVGLDGKCWHGHDCSQTMPRSQIPEMQDDRLKAQVHDLEERVTSVLPTLTKPGYSTSPPLVELRSLPLEQLRSVANFKMHRIGFGSMEWQQSVDLTGADLDGISIMQGGAGIDTVQLAMLNCSCMVVAQNMRPKPGASSAKAARYAARLQDEVVRQGNHFDSYDVANGVLKIVVEHF